MSWRDEVDRYLAGKTGRQKDKPIKALLSKLSAYLPGWYVDTVELLKELEGGA